MPLYSVDIEKQFGQEFWTNRYMVDAASLPAAVTIGNQIVVIERAVHKVGVLFTKVRVSDTVPGNDIYTITQIGTEGQVASGDWMPLFNTVRVDFNTGVGRPSRKYLRLPLIESETGSGVIAAGIVTFLNTNYATPLAALAGFVDVDDQDILSGSVSPLVAMRQLRRGSRRRTTPVI